MMNYLFMYPNLKDQAKVGEELMKSIVITLNDWNTTNQGTNLQSRRNMISCFLLLVWHCSGDVSSGNSHSQLNNYGEIVRLADDRQPNQNAVGSIMVAWRHSRYLWRLLTFVIMGHIMSCSTKFFFFYTILSAYGSTSKLGGFLYNGSKPFSCPSSANLHFFHLSSPY